MSEVGFAHERSGDAASTQKIGAKKMAATRAAKFREETPRKGGGFAIEDRDTALQQYAQSPLCTQVQKGKIAKIFSAEILVFLTKYCLIFRCCRLRNVLVRRNKLHLVRLIGGFTGLSRGRNKRVARIP